MQLVFGRGVGGWILVNLNLGSVGSDFDLADHENLILDTTAGNCTTYG